MDINILLFDDFETLDAFGPVEILGRLEGYRLHFVSVMGGVVTSRQGTEIITKTVDDMNTEGILVIPGGQGTRALVKDDIYIDKLYRMVFCAKYCLTICTGSALLARTGLLNGRKATSNKRALEWVRSVNTNVDWVQKARWVVDGKFYTSSGVSAGMDMVLGFTADIVGRSIADEIATAIEYLWNSDQGNDCFAQVL